MEKKSEPNLATIIATAVGAMAKPVIARVEFPDDNSELKGFGVLCRSGHVVDCSYASRVLGVTSNYQLELLNKANIPYKLIE